MRFLHARHDCHHRSPNGERVACGSSDQFVYVWDAMSRFAIVDPCPVTLRRYLLYRCFLAHLIRSIALCPAGGSCTNCPATQAQ
eukprot:scaffold191774_cov33-Tisochrysis_lutea.AAC.3